MGGPGPVVTMRDPLAEFLGALEPGLWQARVRDILDGDPGRVTRVAAVG